MRLTTDWDSIDIVAENWQDRVYLEHLVKKIDRDLVPILSHFIDVEVCADMDEEKDYFNLLEYFESERSEQMPINVLSFKFMGMMVPPYVMAKLTRSYKQYKKSYVPWARDMYKENSYSKKELTDVGFKFSLRKEGKPRS